MVAMQTEVLDINILPYSVCIYDVYEKFYGHLLTRNLSALKVYGTSFYSLHYCSIVGSLGWVKIQKCTVPELKFRHPEKSPILQQTESEHKTTLRLIFESQISENFSLQEFQLHSTHELLTIPFLHYYHEDMINGYPPDFSLNFILSSQEPASSVPSHS